VERAEAAVAVVLIGALATQAAAAELRPSTVTAFEQYQRAAEAAIAADLVRPDRFVRALRGRDAQRRDIDAQLRRGEVVVERLKVGTDGGAIAVPGGLVHHWMGTAFVPGTHVDAAVSLLQDYDRHAQFFRPNVVRSKTLERDGDQFRVFLRFFFKKVIAVTVNTESIALFTRYGADRVSSTIRSTRIAEVEDAETPREHERPVGRDGGYLWRLNTYWRFLERDGGTYVECESLTLTRGVPVGFGWLIGPFVTSVPRETVALTLEATRRTLQNNQ
jgi:hypothetical protein